MKSFLKRMVFGALFTLPSLFLPAQDAPDSAISLTIRFPGGISEFHVGEKIPVELSFTSSAPETFQLNPRNYDRSGRLDVDEFHVSPEGRDPLSNYLQGFEGLEGGLSPIPKYLSSEPQTITEQLNQWVAIEEPGHYSLHVTSKRAARGGQTFSNPIPVESNTLEFEVVEADTAWQQETLLAALAILNDPGRRPEEKDAALSALRFLDSPASIRELARRITDPGQEYCSECGFGLIGSRHQKLVVQEMESRLAAPEAAVTSGFLYLLTEIKFMLNHDPMPPWPEDEEQQKTYQAQTNARTKEFEALQTSLFVKTASLLSVKTAAARAQTVQTLLTAASNGNENTRASARLSDSDIEAALLGLPEDAQFSLLKYFWPKIRRPMMVGVLEQILDQHENRNAQLRAVAMVRLNELDHERAAAKLLEEIQHPQANRAFSGKLDGLLSILPEKLMPQFDNMLAARLEKEGSPTLPFDSQLVAHYATKAILPRVKAVYLGFKGGADCQVADGLVFYFLRVDADFGLQQLKDANLYCMGAALEMAARMNRWKALEPVMIARLNDPDWDKARNAAEVLARFGGAEAKQAMFKRLRRFHEQWAKHEAEFQSSPHAPKEVLEADSFQFGLVQAMGTAQGWILDDAELTEMEQLVIGHAKANISSWHPSGSEKAAIDITMNLIDSEDFNVTVDRYEVHNIGALRAKLGQFPAGTSFVLLYFASTDPDKVAEPVIQAIHEMAEEHGLNVETVRNQ